MDFLIFIRHQIGKLREWQAERDAIRHLRNMDDHFLRDIGIERRDIEAVVHGLVSERNAEKTRQRPLRENARNELKMVPAE